MKKLIIILVVLISAVYIVPAQEKEKKPESKPKQHMQVPQAVKDNFTKMFSDVKVTHWEKEHGNWEAEFKKENTHMSAVFSSDGKFLYSETAIKVSDLPKSVSDYAAKNYPGKPIVKAEKMTDDKGAIMYEAMIKGVPHLIFDGQGNFLKKEG